MTLLINLEYIFQFLGEKEKKSMIHQLPASVVIWFCLAFSMLIETRFLLAHLKGKEYHDKTGKSYTHSNILSFY